MHQGEFIQFNELKLRRLGVKDKSKKGSYDAPIQDVVDFINNCLCYFTTSSCSGRVVVFEEEKENSKKNCKFLFSSHSSCSVNDLQNAIQHSLNDAFFKFEPFVLHVQCNGLTSATDLLAAAISSGHRNSGLSISKKGKIILAVRSTHSLQAPLTLTGRSIVSLEYLEHLAKLSAQKMEENLQLIDRFFEAVKKINYICDSKDNEPFLCDTVVHKTKAGKTKKQSFFKIDTNSEFPETKKDLSLSTDDSEFSSYCIFNDELCL